MDSHMSFPPSCSFFALFYFVPHAAASHYGLQSTGNTLGVTLSGAVATSGLSVISTTTLTNTNSLIHGTVAVGTASTTAMLRLNDGTQDAVLVQSNGLVQANSGIQVLATTTNAGDVLTVTGGLQVPDCIGCRLPQ